MRHQLARALFGDASVSIAEVVFFGSYAGPGPFNCSFKRWTETTAQLHRRPVRHSLPPSRCGSSNRAGSISMRPADAGGVRERFAGVDIGWGPATNDTARFRGTDRSLHRRGLKSGDHATACCLLLSVCDWQKACVAQREFRNRCSQDCRRAEAKAFLPAGLLPRFRPRWISTAAHQAGNRPQSTGIPNVTGTRMFLVASQ